MTTKRDMCKIKSPAGFNRFSPLAMVLYELLIIFCKNENEKTQRSLELSLPVGKFELLAEKKISQK